ncbi:MAG: hypothetical protein LBF90_01305 [Prevotellaceae bacterium]|nr:hypothetical protein [Prevotellaceae bacterium]
MNKEFLSSTFDFPAGRAESPSSAAQGNALCRCIRIALKGRDTDCALSGLPRAVARRRWRRRLRKG